jgi:hypothetical protein
MRRGRPPRTTRREGVEKSPLNAKIDEQLLLAFNDFSQKPENWSGTRDELVEFVLRTFLTSPRKPPRQADRPEEQEVAAAADSTRRVFDVIAGARRHAEAIVRITTNFDEPQ